MGFTKIVPDSRLFEIEVKKRTVYLKNYSLGRRIFPVTTVIVLM